MRRTLKTGIHLNQLDVWILLFRILIAAFMLTHGLPKFFKLMAGGEVTFGDPLGFGAFPTLLLAVFAEVVCSTFILIGLGTRLATIPLMITMAVAAFMVHGDDPFGKKELPLLYLLSFITLFVFGSGKYSVDFLLSRSLKAKK